MKWEKIGKIISPQKKYEWSQSHCWVPFAEHLQDDVYRIYFASRNKDNFSQIGAAIIDINSPHNVLEYTDKPLFGLGELGTFDDSAVLPSWITYTKEKKYLWYIGWMQGKRVPYYASLGLAVCDNDGSNNYVRYSKGPFFERNNIDPYMTASACVLKINDSLWQMWYLSNTKWELNSQDTPVPRYHLKYAESNDGVTWDRKGIVAIDFKSEDEYAISRPSVIIENGVYKMWYSYRGEFYRIGYAESCDGVTWERLDDSVGLDVSSNGFDSKMIEYPHVFDHKGQRIMLYNGNNFGEDGIGMAVQK